MTADLRDEIKQTKPFESLEQEAWLNLVRTSAVLTHEAEQVFKARRITLTQYNTLRILRGAGSAGLCGTDIRERLLSQVPDVTRLLDRLADAGLIERTRDESNRRFVTARITAAGLSLLQELDPVVRELHRRQLGHMTPEQLRTLIDLVALARNPE
jgi:DNA-binding MarR family transcriptional regulator